MTLKTQEAWSELIDEHFLVSVYDWVHATLLCSVMGVPYFPVSTVHLTKMLIAPALKTLKTCYMLIEVF